MAFHFQPLEELYTLFNTSKKGLSSIEADEIFLQVGPNRLGLEKKISSFEIFFNQFKSFIIYILLFAVLFSVLIGEYFDSLIILAILIANSLIGFFQEFSANKSLEALKKLGALHAKAIRDETIVQLNAEQLVPGDIIVLEAGDKVPSDARIIEAVRLKIEEASLTGESVPVMKSPGQTAEKVQLGDQFNMLFAGTSIVAGNCRALVTSTGVQTELGKISQMLAQTEQELTPLQRRLDRFGRKLGVVILFICLLIFGITLTTEYLQSSLNPETLVGLAFIAISLAVAAVPTALPAVVTIALSIGVKKLLDKKALVRRLSSVETLGSCDVICTDKTGTLTQNQMTVRYAWSLDGETTLSGVGYDPEGAVKGPSNKKLFHIGNQCNNSQLKLKENTWSIAGDPTEAALLVSARKTGMNTNSDTFVRLDELPFDSIRKRMSVLLQADKKLVVLVKGAPAELLKECQYIAHNNSVVELTGKLRQKVLEQNEHYSSQALRVLGFAYKDIQEKSDFTEENLVFVGLQAMIDPPRPEVAEAISRTKEAGIKTIMITGDYAATACSVGREIGISGQVANGIELEQMSETELINALSTEISIFARVTPEHKQRIVTALQKMNHIVAMTGDGVNDAPALKKSDIGVAVGSGTEVAKEEADLVLLDNSFLHIVNAIEEGRGIYDNIQKSIMLLLSGNLGEVLIIFFAVISGLNLPLTAILLLWVNMVTDGAPALAYSVDPYGKRIMKRPPKRANEGILPPAKLSLIGVLGIIGTVIALSIFVYYGGNSNNPEELIHAQTMVFNFVVLYELILTFVIRTMYKVNFLENKWIWAAVIISFLLQGILMYTPIHTAFGIVPLGLPELMVLAAAGGIFYLTFLLYKQISEKIFPAPW